VSDSVSTEKSKAGIQLEVQGISREDFHREVCENCALLGYYATSSGNLLPTFRDNLSVPSLGSKNLYAFTA